MAGCSLCQNGQHHPAAAGTFSGRFRSSTRAPLASRLTAHQMDTASVSIFGFGDVPTEYVMDLVSIDFDGQNVTVEFMVTRNGSTAIVEDAVARLVVGGVEQDSVQANGASIGWDYTLSGTASEGQSVIVEWTSESFDGPHTMAVSGQVPTSPTNGGGGGGGGGGNGGDGGNGGGSRSGLILVGVVAVGAVAASRWS